MSKETLEAWDIVKVMVISNQKIISDRCILHKQPAFPGDCWQFENIVTGINSWVTEPCTVEKLPPEKEKCSNS